MNTIHLGDSYDVVKRFLLTTLSSFGSWHTEAMFTNEPSVSEADAFARFLGTPLLTSHVIPPGHERAHHFVPCRGVGNLFLDPSTGLKLSGAPASSAHLYADEVEALVRCRAASLTLLFDQSLARGKENTQVALKLEHFRARGIFGFAYVSHASFLCLSLDRDLLVKARQALLETGLPEHRVTPVAA